MGKPVVSVSSTTSYEIGYSTTDAPPVSTTKRYGISTTNLFPLITSNFKSYTESPVEIVPDLSKTGNTSRARIRLDPLIETEKEIKTSNPKDELVASVDSEDPFANYDWKKDSSSGVTSTLKTRYEKLFGSNNDRSRNNNKRPTTPKINNKARQTTSTNLKTTKSISETTTPNPNLDTYRSRRRSRGRGTNRSLPPAPEHKAFSNFRYFKTAFGRSESVSTSNGSLTNSREIPNFGRSFRPEKTASYNTRYSKYG